MKTLLFAVALFTVASALSAGAAEGRLETRKLAEKRVAALPPGPLSWRIESFDSVAGAQAAAGPYGIAAQSKDGRAWLFTLEGAGAKLASAGREVARVGPIAPFSANHYLLRINEATGTRGATTPVHTHPGSEAFFVLAGEQSIRGPDGVMTLRPGQPSAGSGAGVPMQVTSTGSTDLDALVMFVVDADKPFSSSALIQ